MYIFYNAQKDATVYSIQPDQNTGRDEILEINKTYILGQIDIARPLIKFDVTELSSSIATGDITASSVELILKECDGAEIPMEYIIYAYPISQSWDMGIGTKFDEISTQNVTWNSRITDIDWIVTGSDYTNSYAASQSIEYISTDLNIDISTTLNAWLNNDIANHGIVLKLSDDKENDNNDYGSLKYFSKETNTIYQPKLRIGWDDSTFSTGSLPALTADDIKVSFKRLKSHYKVGSESMIRVFGREKYPMKTYVNEYAYNDVTYLPSTTYYQVRDAQTDEIIVPFSEYSKVSCDSDGNFFNLNLKNWETNRDYYIEIKVDRNGEVEYFSDHNLTFVVEK